MLLIGYNLQHDIIEPLLKTSYVRFFLWVYLNTGEASSALLDANIPSNTRIWSAMARLTSVVGGPCNGWNANPFPLWDYRGS